MGRSENREWQVAENENNAIFLTIKKASISHILF